MNIIVYMKYNLRNENKKDIRKNFIKKENFYEKNIDHNVLQFQKNVK